MSDRPPMNAENPADAVIEQAARRLAWAMADADGIHPGDFETDPFDDLTDDAQRDVLAFARALHAAGLLADPADRDGASEWRRKILDTMGYDDTPEYAEELLTYLPVWKAEGEADREHVTELRATVARVRALANRYAAREASGVVGYGGLADDLHDALDGAGEQNE